MTAASSAPLLLRLQLVVALLGAACGTPLGPHKCTHARKCRNTHFQHVSDLRDSSVAPWELMLSTEEGREPEVIEYAVCKSCTVDGMVAKPIVIQIPVCKRVNNTLWFRCPYELAVGCTCVSPSSRSDPPPHVGRFS